MPPLGEEGRTEIRSLLVCIFQPPWADKLGAAIPVVLWLLGRAVLVFCLVGGVLFRHGRRRFAHFLFKALGHGLVHLTELLSELQHFGCSGAHSRNIGV